MVEAVVGLVAPIPDLTERFRMALNELLPAMVADGGGAELVSLDEGVATLRLSGTCLFCPSRQLSAAALQRGLAQRVPEVSTIDIIYPSISRESHHVATELNPKAV